MQSARFLTIAVSIWTLLLMSVTPDAISKTLGRTWSQSKEPTNRLGYPSAPTQVSRGKRRENHHPRRSQLRDWRRSNRVGTPADSRGKGYGNAESYPGSLQVSRRDFDRREEGRLWQRPSEFVSRAGACRGLGRTWIAVLTSRPRQPSLAVPSL